MTLDYAKPPPGLPQRLRRSLFLIALAVLAIIVFIHLFTPFVFTSQEIDLASGRVHTVTLYLRCFTSTSPATETPFSRALTPADKSLPPIWHPTSCRRPNGAYELTSMGAANSQTRELTDLWRLGQYSPAAQRQSALTLLSLWSASQSTTSAERYLATLFYLLDTHPGPTDTPDLPP